MNPVDFLSNELLEQAKTLKKPFLSNEKIISLLDLTSLNPTDNERSILQLCNKAKTPLGNVASVCIYPQFVSFSKQQLAETGIKICTVANFPAGNEDQAITLNSIRQSLQDGADEIDVVIPYQDFLLNKNAQAVTQYVEVCKRICGPNIVLKIIIESGAMETIEQIYKISCAAISGGADFIKTSTGKIAVGATLEASNAMLTAIKQVNSQTGFKAAGGLRTMEQVASHIFLAKEIMGENWLKPKNFRIGTSILLDELLAN